MQRVLVVDKNKQPLMPCHPARARLLLHEGKAAVLRRYPFTIILNERDSGDTQPIQVKLDPGSQITGIAVVVTGKRGKRVVWAAELTHRGQQIHNALLRRQQLRRVRRVRKIRYRQPRFLNRRRQQGWLPPSLQSRVDNIRTWLKRIQKFTPMTYLGLELTRFDTQKLQNPEISGIEYLQGTLHGYEVREYLLEKWKRKCVYCGVTHAPLQIEHLIPKSRGGSNRVSNLAIACAICNKKKGNRTAAEFGFPHLEAQAQQPLKDAAAINATRWAVFEQLQQTGLPVEIGTGGQTKFNRIRQGYPKTHWLDAVCVGTSGLAVFVPRTLLPLHIAAKGHGTRQRCRTNAFGFPIAHAPSLKQFRGFQTGDMVKAIIPKGKFAGTYIGRIVIRYRPSFQLNGFDVHPQYLKTIHHADGYAYQ